MKYYISESISIEQNNGNFPEIVNLNNKVKITETMFYKLLKKFSKPEDYKNVLDMVPKMGIIIDGICFQISK